MGVDKDQYGEPRPCPFCGGKSFEICPTSTNGRGRWVRCMNCGTEGPVGGSEIDAHNRWNARA